MPLRYHSPHTVTEPASFISDVAALYDGGETGFSLAKLNCEGVPHIGIRWNVARREHDDTAKQTGEVICLGTPAAKGAPSWFILPRELFDPALFSEENSALMTAIEGWLRPGH
ncbi:MAG: hypothetical protein V4649_04755 [Bacteroidota bacterium]